MVYANLLPSKIDNLGIKFNDSHQAILIEVIFYSLLYLLISFLIYAVSDFFKWKISLTDLALKEKYTEIEDFIESQQTRRSKPSSIQEMNIDEEMENFKLSEYKQKLSEELRGRTKLYKYPVILISILRATVDFIAPVVMAAFALMQLHQ